MKTKLIDINSLKSPKGHFLLGNLPEFKTNNKHKILEKWVEECGELFTISLAGKKFVVSANPDTNEQILKLRPSKFRRFAKIDEIFKEMKIEGVFNSEGEDWQRHRKITSEALNVKNVKSFFPVLKDKTDKLLHKFQNFEKQGTIIDLQKEFMGFTIDVTTTIAFGYETDVINNKKNEFQKHLEHIFPMINKRITAPLPLWRYIKNKADKQLLIALEEIEKLIHTFIDDAQQRLKTNPELKENPSNFLEALLVEGEKTTFSNEEIFGNVFTMLLAGEDTTSNSISWAMYYLAQHPDIVNQIRSEANQILGSEPCPTNNKQLAELQLTKAAALEAIRIKPTTPQLYMQAIEDVVINDIAIPSGTNIILQTKVAQNSEAYFSNPDEFNPQRWLNQGCPVDHKHSPNVLKSFGGGSRFCPGMALAINEMVIVLATLCKNFDFKLAVNPEDVEEFFAFTMSPKNLKVKLQSI